MMATDDIGAVSATFGKLELEKKISGIVSDCDDRAVVSSFRRS